MLLCKGQRYVNIIEFEHHPDAALVGLGSEPLKHLTVQDIFLLRNLQGLRVFRHLYKGGKRVP